MFQDSWNREMSSVAGNVCLYSQRQCGSKRFLWLIDSKNCRCRRKFLSVQPNFFIYSQINFKHGQKSFSLQTKATKSITSRENKFLPNLTRIWVIYRLYIAFLKKNLWQEISVAHGFEKFQVWRDISVSISTECCCL